jgi:hypothetical protein
MYIHGSSVAYFLKNSKFLANLSQIFEGGSADNWVPGRQKSRPEESGKMFGKRRGISYPRGASCAYSASTVCCVCAYSFLGGASFLNFPWL